WVSERANKFLVFDVSRNGWPLPAWGEVKLTPIARTGWDEVACRRTIRNHSYSWRLWTAPLIFYEEIKTEEIEDPFYTEGSLYDIVQLRKKRAEDIRICQGPPVKEYPLSFDQFGESEFGMALAENRVYNARVAAEAALQKAEAALNKQYRVSGNHTPVAVSGDYPARNMPCTFTLNARGSTDADNDALKYRWVITGIPWSDNHVLSQKYVLYQKLSDAQVATFEPDLAGQWQVDLDVTDGIEDAQPEPGYRHRALINAVRHILWVQHSNGPYDPKTGLGIELRLYDPKVTPTKPEKTTDGKPTQWGGPYYVEVSHEQAGLYLNFNDEGMPVDEDSWRPTDNKPLFEVIMGESPAGAVGAYDGLYGSTPLVNSTGKATPLKRVTPGSFELVSASAKGGYVKILICPNLQIKEVRCSTDDCSYGAKGGDFSVPSDEPGVMCVSRFAGQYKIQQWVDHYEWLNTNGQGFLPVRKAKFGYYGGYMYIPDWMERRAAETLEKFPEVMPFVKRILNLPEWKRYIGLYYPTSKQIWIKSYFGPLRHNLPVSDCYGFIGKASLDETARHEAYHSYYYNSFPSFKNNDGDSYPDYNWNQPVKFSDGKDILQYARDSGSNFFGMEDVDSMRVIYKGDEVFDRKRNKYLFDVELCPSVEEIERNSRIEIDVRLPENIPISEVLVHSIEINFTPILSSEDVVLLHKGIHYTFDKTPLDQKTKAPKMRIMLINGPEWRKLLEKQRRQTFNLLITYEIWTAHNIDEYDASRIEPGEYTGKWSVNEDYE
ncbi:MAG: hypothetical protein NT033_07140, partial [Candidatus Omnitrophica bacterium]|nr:hypothetical protein [Candidatus Omnitrophota bacterium]